MLKHYNKLTFNLHKMNVPFSRTDKSIFIFISFHLMTKNVREFPTVISLNIVPEKGIYFLYIYKVSNIIRRLIDNIKLLLIYTLLLSHSFIFLGSIFYQCIYGFIPIK